MKPVLWKGWPYLYFSKTMDKGHAISKWEDEPEAETGAGRASATNHLLQTPRSERAWSGEGRVSALLFLSPECVKSCGPLHPGGCCQPVWIFTAACPTLPKATCQSIKQAALLSAAYFLRTRRPIKQGKVRKIPTLAALELQRVMQPSGATV